MVTIQDFEYSNCSGLISEREMSAVHEVIERHLWRPLKIRCYQTRGEMETQAFDFLCGIMSRCPENAVIQKNSEQIQRLSAYALSTMLHSDIKDRYLILGAIKNGVLGFSKEHERVSLLFARIWKSVLLDQRGVFLAALTQFVFVSHCEEPFCESVLCALRQRDLSIETATEAVGKILSSYDRSRKIDGLSRNIQLVLKELQGKYSQKVETISALFGRFGYRPSQTSYRGKELRLEFLAKIVSREESPFGLAVGYEAFKKMEQEGELPGDEFSPC